MPDFFHCMHELVKNYSLPIGQRLRHAQQDLVKAKEAMARCQGAQPAPKAQALVATRQVEVTQWEEACNSYRGLLETFSLTLHPFRIWDAAPQTSAQVESQLRTIGEAITTLAQRHQLPARHDALTKVCKQVPALAALVDVWWQGINRDLEPFGLSPRWRQWVDECLLPMVYWEHQVARMMCQHFSGQKISLVFKVCS